MNTNDDRKQNNTVTAWAVEVNGNIFASNIYPDRGTARYIRNEVAENFNVNKATVRKVIIQVVKGR